MKSKIASDVTTDIVADDSTSNCKSVTEGKIINEHIKKLICDQGARSQDQDAYGSFSSFSSFNSFTSWTRSG